jgi:hypothetical protein
VRGDRGLEGQLGANTIVGVARPRFLHKDDISEVGGPWWRKPFEDLGWIKKKMVRWGTIVVPSYKPPEPIAPDKRYPQP